MNKTTDDVNDQLSKLKLIYLARFNKKKKIQLEVCTGIKGRFIKKVHLREACCAIKKE